MIRAYSRMLLLRGPREASRRPGGWRRRARWAFNATAVALSLWWLASSPWLTDRGPSVHATMLGSLELEHAPKSVRQALASSGLTGSKGWDEVAYVPSSNQRVLWPEEWSDPDLRIIAPEREQKVASGRASRKPADQAKEVKRRKVAVAASSPDKRFKAGAKARGARARKSSRKNRGARREWFTVTAYCPCRKCCGRWARYHRTASGRPLSYNGGHLVAADTKVLPFNTKVRIPGYAGGRSVPVVDRGSAIRGRMIDVFFPTHWRAKCWGKKRLMVEIVQ